jgi:hypothetical protein
MFPDSVPRQTRWQLRRTAGKQAYQWLVTILFTLLLVAFVVYVVALQRLVAPAFRV